MSAYQPTVEYGGLTWTHDPEGEHGEYSAEYQGYKLTVSTDRNGEEWDYQIDDGEYVFHLETMEEAMDEAMEDVSADQRGSDRGKHTREGP